MKYKLTHSIPIPQVDSHGGTVVYIPAWKLCVQMPTEAVIFFKTD